MSKTTEPQAFFPLFVNLSGRKALVAGGGKVAERRIKALIDFNADITVISPDVSGCIANAAALGAIRLLKRKYHDNDIAALTPFLVIAATSDREVNRQIAIEAKSLDILVSVADCRAECTCFFPAIADNGAYIAGLVSKDGNHAGVKQMAEKIRETLSC
ncbi:MAG: bifunctional precorrin-2 dehydrogenase/sirohydrochlorin ferrochelatase [Treponema sp.]|nr:bifunctional precorrin-2 dehydrogenase/sirohydrochlorin ferrochelatase [Treponema sp.]